MSLFVACSASILAAQGIDRRPVAYVVFVKGKWSVESRVIQGTTPIELARELYPGDRIAPSQPVAGDLVRIYYTDDGSSEDLTIEKATQYSVRARKKSTDTSETSWLQRLVSYPSLKQASVRGGAHEDMLLPDRESSAGIRDFGFKSLPGEASIELWSLQKDGQVAGRSAAFEVSLDPVRKPNPILLKPGLYVAYTLRADGRATGEAFWVLVVNASRYEATSKEMSGLALAVAQWSSDLRSTVRRTFLLSKAFPK